MQNYGSSLFVQKRVDEAEKYLRAAIDARVGTPSWKQPNTAFALNGLALLLREQGKFPEAEQTMRDAIDIFNATLSKGHRARIVALADLATILVSSGKLDEADQLCGEAMAGVAASPSKQAVWIPTVYRAVGRLRIAQRKFAEAEAALLEAQRISSVLQGADGAVRKSTKSLVDLYVEWDAVAPGMGHDVKKAHWVATLNAL
jgi:tetratricopeptide (TPR) repeat protein